MRDFMIVALVTAVFFANPIAGYASSPVTLKLAGPTAIGTPTTKAGEKFVELVEAKSAGQLKVKYYPANQLGGTVAQIEAMQSGNIEMAQDALEWLGRYVKDFNIFGFSFVFRDGNHLETFISGPESEHMRKRMIDEWGIRILAANQVKAPRVLLSKRPVRSLDDVRGLKIRVPDIESYVECWRALGASPTKVAWGETYLALRQGVVDACEAPLDSVYGMKFYEPARYITLTNHLYTSLGIFINEKHYKKLPPEFQRILVEAAYEAGKFCKQIISEELDGHKAKMMKEGVTFIEVDRTPFRNRIITLASEMEKKGFWSPGLFGRIQGMK